MIINVLDYCTGTVNFYYYEGDSDSEVIESWLRETYGHQEDQISWMSTKDLKYYIETWAIYFDICDEYSAIKGENIYKKFKLVISFDSLYVPEESLKNDLFHILGDYNINNLDDLLNCFILRRYFYDC